MNAVLAILVLGALLAVPAVAEGSKAVFFCTDPGETSFSVQWSSDDGTRCYQSPDGVCLSLDWSNPANPYTGVGDCTGWL
ncbi:MAG: hypothetical protein QOG31_687 [Thermoplasmata archaeon]|jgi:hypothetical protein|nr:hypothetical protein [Thermoplasmata archaeon]